MGSLDYVRNSTRRKLLRGEHVNWIENSRRKTYIRQMVLSTPAWVNRSVLKAMQQDARRLTATTGTLHVIDHIVPLNHPRVCGLTVPWNLRVVPHHVNSAKGNKFRTCWCPEQKEFSYDP